MKGQLMISSLSINKDEKTDRKYIYSGLIDFYADTEENLARLTNIMSNNGLFGFGNVGSSLGLDERTNRYWTFDDGASSVDWLLDVFKVIREMNKKGDNITITINKKFLLHHEAVEDYTLAYGKKPRNKECLIDVYIYHLKEIADQHGYSDLLKTQAKGKLRKSILSKIENDLIMIN